MSHVLLVWWITLYIISTINVCAWGISAFFLARNKVDSKNNIFIFRKSQLFLSGFFVFGCAFRAILPRIDVERIVLFPSWLSGIFIGRSIATIAEICFIFQLSLIINFVGKRKNSNFMLIISRLIIPLIGTAEVFSWYAIITTNYWGNIIEESIWTLVFILILSTTIGLWFRHNFMYRKFLLITVFIVFLYTVFMVTVDIPMYISRYVSDQSHGKIYLSLSEGVKDAWSRRVVSSEWSQWEPQISWMSLYFSVAVWISITLANVPISILESI